MMLVLPSAGVLRALAATPEGREQVEGWIAVLQLNCDAMKADLEKHVLDYEQTISKLKAALGELH